MTRGLSPEHSATVTRSSFGRPVGGAKRGLTPPTDRMNPDPGPDVHRARNAAAPVSRNLCASRESTSTASTAAVPWSKSITPTAFRYQPHQIVVGRRQQRADPTEDQQPPLPAELEDQRQVERHQRRREPGDLRQQPEQVAAAAGREHRREVRMIAGALLIGPRGNSSFAERVVLHSLAQRRPR